MRSIKLAVLAAIFLLPTSSLAAPAVDGVSGTVSNGQSITLSGSGFGSKSPAAPILVENFDSGTNGQSLDGWNGWVKYNGLNGGTLSNTSPYSGTLSAYNRITGPNAANPISWEESNFNTSYHTFSATDEIYYSYVAKFVSTGDTAGVVKWGRVNTNQATVPYYSGPGDINLQLGYISFNTGTSAEPGNDDDGKSPWGMPLKEANWTRHEMYKKLSTPGVANGMVHGKIGAETRTWTNKITRETGFSFQHTSVLLGLMYANAENDGDHRMYIDDVYVDNTRARVELCTGSTWSNRGSCNPQPPTSWGSTSITATVNVSSLNGTLYAYVVDSDGAVNSSGHIVDTGGSTITCYQDADNDLYGHGVSETATNCSSGYYIASHFTALTGDCNDNSASINPGATDICGNGIDEDCSGADLACGGGGGGLTISTGSTMAIGAGTMAITPAQ